MSKAYYNENDKFAAQWLRELIKVNAIALGDVDERSIAEVRPKDLAGYNQCHFFAGVGGWSHALRLAGWPDDREVWTGSCPCQPFSVAGKRKGTSDERHLWPVWFELIRECRPAVIFGEQVAGSPITGKCLREDDLYQMLGKKACFDVLLLSQRILQERLQKMRESSTQSTQTCYLCGCEDSRERPDTCSSGSISSEQNETTLQFGCEEYPSTDISGLLRIDGNSFRSTNSKSLEYTFSRSNNSEKGLHKGQYPSSYLCSECYGSQLGTAYDSSNSGGVTESHQGGLERLIEEIGREFEKTPSTWLSSLRSDLGRSRYSFGACVLTAAGAGAPHIRQRLYWVADRGCGEGGVADAQHTIRRAECDGVRDAYGRDGFGGCGDVSGLAHDPLNRRREERAVTGGDVARSGTKGRGAGFVPGGADGGRDSGHNATSGLVVAAGEQAGIPGQSRVTRGAVGDSSGLANPQLSQSARLEQHSRQNLCEQETDGLSGSGYTTGFWRDPDWLYCRDHKYRPVKRGSFPLVAGLPRGVVPSGDPGESYAEATSEARVGRLRGYGNSLVSGCAKAFIESYLEIRDEESL